MFQPVQSKKSKEGGNRRRQRPIENGRGRPSKDERGIFFFSSAVTHYLAPLSFPAPPLREREKAHHRKKGGGKEERDILLSRCMTNDPSSHPFSLPILLLLLPLFFLRPFLFFLLAPQWSSGDTKWTLLAKKRRKEKEESAHCVNHPPSPFSPHAKIPEKRRVGVGGHYNYSGGR